MKYIFLLSVLCYYSPVFSQLKGAVPQSSAPSHINEERVVSAPTPEAKAKNNADKLHKTLKLNEKQHSDVYAAFLAYEKNVDKTTKSNMTKQEQFKKVNQLNMGRQKRLKEILTKEQYHAYIMSFP